MNQLLANLSSWFNGLQPSERRTVAIGGVVLGLILIFQLLSWGLGSIRELERDQARLIERSARIANLIERYREASRELKANVDTTQISYAERLAERLDITSALQGVRPTSYGNFEAYEIRLERLYATQVQDIIESLKRDGAQVLSMQLEKRFDNPDQANLILILSRGV